MDARDETTPFPASLDGADSESDSRHGALDSLLETAEVDLPPGEMDDDEAAPGETPSRHPDSRKTETMSAQPATGPQLAFSRNRHRDRLRELSDKELLLQLQEDDETALDEIIERKMAPLIKTVQRILGDLEESRDIVQVTFFRLWEHRHRFDAKWSPNTWIYRIATNLAIDHLRSRQSRQRATEPVRLHIQSSHDERSRRDRTRIQEGEVMNIFRELAADLTEKQRVVFVLREIEGLPSKEVAEIAGCRESTVRNHLFNARKILRQSLASRYPEYARMASSEEHRA